MAAIPGLIAGAAGFIGRSVSGIAESLINLNELIRYQYDVIEEPQVSAFAAVKAYAREMRGDIALMLERYQPQNLTIAGELGHGKEKLAKALEELAKLGDVKVSQETKDLILTVLVGERWVTPERFVLRQEQAYREVANNPHVPDKIKDDLKPTTMERLDYHGIIEKMRDLELCETFEGKRNRHEGDLGIVTASKRIRGEHLDDLWVSNFTNFRSYHGQVFRDKTIFTAALPVDDKQLSQLKTDLAQKFREQAKKYREQAKTATGEDKKKLNQMAADYEKQKPEDLLNWFKDRGEKGAEANLNMLIGKYSELVDKGHSLNYRRKFAQLGEKIWGHMVNGASFNAWAGESEAQAFMAIYHKMAMNLMDREVDYTINQFKKNGNYYQIDEVHSPGVGEPSVNKYVEHLQDFLARKDVRERFFDSYQYTFDYDGKNPDTFTLKDAVMVTRDSLLTFLEHKNPSRHFGSHQQANSLKATFHKWELIRGGLEIGKTESMASLPEGNIRGKVVKYKLGYDGKVRGGGGIFQQTSAQSGEQGDQIVLTAAQAEEQHIKPGDPVLIDVKKGDVIVKEPMVSKLRVGSEDEFRMMTGFIATEFPGASPALIARSIRHLISFDSVAHYTPVETVPWKWSKEPKPDTQWKFEGQVKKGGSTGNGTYWELNGDDIWKEAYEENVARDLGRLDKVNSVGKLARKTAVDAGRDVSDDLMNTNGKWNRSWMNVPLSIIKNVGEFIVSPVVGLRNAVARVRNYAKEEQVMSVSSRSLLWGTGIATWLAAVPTISQYVTPDFNASSVGVEVFKNNLNTGAYSAGELPRDTTITLDPNKPGTPTTVLLNHMLITPTDRVDIKIPAGSNFFYSTDGYGFRGAEGSKPIEVTGTGLFDAKETVGTSNNRFVPEEGPNGTITWKDAVEVSRNSNGQGTQIK